MALQPHNFLTDKRLNVEEVACVIRSEDDDIAIDGELRVLVNREPGLQTSEYIVAISFVSRNIDTRLVHPIVTFVRVVRVRLTLRILVQCLFRRFLVVRGSGFRKSTIHEPSPRECKGILSSPAVRVAKQHLGCRTHLL